MYGFRGSGFWGFSLVTLLLFFFLSMQASLVHAEQSLLQSRLVLSQLAGKLHPAPTASAMGPQEALPGGGLWLEVTGCRPQHQFHAS